MNIETAKAYLGTAHMNRKVANYLIQLIDELQEEANAPAPKSSFLMKKYDMGFEDCKLGFKEILDKEI